MLMTMMMTMVMMKMMKEVIPSHVILFGRNWFMLYQRIAIMMLILMNLSHVILRCKHVKFETGIYRIRDFIRWTRDLSHVTLSQSSFQLVYTGSDNFEHWIRKGRSLTTSTAGQDKDANALLLQNV